MSRHVYQSSQGGKTYVPLEVSGQIIGSNTPRFAQIQTWKYGHMSGSAVQEDFRVNHGRHISVKLVQSTARAVGNIIGSVEQEWHLGLPELSGVTQIVVSRDGACVPMIGGIWQTAMCGTISFYNAQSERLHTIYQASAPEKGKAVFDSIMTSEIQKVKKAYPDAVYVGLADGAADNWTFLESFCTIFVLDFYHVCTYLSEASKFLFPHKADQEMWYKQAVEELKKSPGAAEKILEDMKRRFKTLVTPQNGAKKEKIIEKLENVQKAITYFENHKHQMDYALYLDKGIPIGSGVTEAACKVLIKQRLAQSGMKWTHKSIDDVLMIRANIFTQGRWEKVWQKIAGKENTDNILDLAAYSRKSFYQNEVRKMVA